MPRGVAVLISRVRLPLLVVVIGFALASGRFLPVLPWWLVVAVGAPLIWVVLRAGTVRAEPVEVAAPVRGRWSAVNSPADRVPSHGVQGYGQAYAIDLVHEPGDPPRPGFGWWPLARRPREFPGFGQPVYAVAPGTVVRTSGWQRDHWSRSSWLGLPFLLAEALVRELLGPGRLFGNHLVLDLGDGVYALYAHLQRGSIAVTPGQRVAAGEVLAACGNSGNSSEPHLHFQLMDHRRASVAAGLPMRFRFEVDGGTETGVPAAGRPFHAPVPADRGTGDVDRGTGEVDRLVHSGGEGGS